MTHVVLAEGLFAPSAVPRADADGLWLPDGSRITLADTEARAAWIWTPRFGEARAIEALGLVLDQPTYRADMETAALEKLRSEGSMHTILRYAGFAIERFYLGDRGNGAEAAERAARVGSLCLQLWQERVAIDDRAELALAMLWRSYWQALVILVKEVNERLAATGVMDRDQAIKLLVRELRAHRELAWLVGWVDRLDVEYLRALTRWRQVCIHASAARFFGEWLCAWERQPRERWQILREREVDATVWNGATLRPPGVMTYQGRQELVLLVEQWYLPRYNIEGATRLRWQIAQAERSQERRNWAALLVLPILGAERLWAGIGVGYIATMLQGDTWRTLVDITTNRGRLGWTLAAALLAMAGLYLSYGVYRRSGITLWRRVGLLLLKGEVFALPTGWFLAIFLAPSVVGQSVPGNAMLPLVFLYGQLTLFIGIFTQLIFDEKPVTMPLDVG